jgi:hypothetical protein
VAASGLALLGLFIAGCTGDNNESLTAQRLQGIAQVYLDYAAARSAGPASEQILREHLTALPDFVREGYGFAGVSEQEAFRSLRDGEPFVIRYGLGLSGLSDSPSPVLAYESRGTDAGMRLVVYLSTQVEQVDEARLRELVGEVR